MVRKFRDTPKFLNAHLQKCCCIELIMSLGSLRIVRRCTACLAGGIARDVRQFSRNCSPACWRCHCERGFLCASSGGHKLDPLSVAGGSTGLHASF